MAWGFTLERNWRVEFYVNLMDCDDFMVKIRKYVDDIKNIEILVKNPAF